jgi:putative transposase
MPRAARIIFPDVPHHVVQRGNRRMPVFFMEDDYLYYLHLLAKGCKRAGTEIWGYCLMPNHVHLILVPRDHDGLRKAIAEPHRIFSKRINERNGWIGHLWQERFASYPMSDPYLIAALRYIELNPVRAGLKTDPFDYPWSSAKAHREKQSSKLINVEPVADLLDNWEDFLKSGMTDEEIERFRSNERSGHWLK